MSQSKNYERIPVMAAKAEAEAQAEAKIEPVLKEWDEKTRKEMKPWYIENLEGQKVADFFGSNWYRLNDELDTVIKLWLNTKGVYRALKMLEVTDNDVDLLDIPLPQEFIVAKIKQAYKENKANQTK